MLMVSDTGIGMDSETQAHIFEPFFTTKEIGKGTGLGLSTVYGVVRQSGGHIWVNSEPNMGTTFRIYMPAVSQNLRMEKPKVVSARLARGTGTVLLVEDAEALRQLTRELLEECGYTVLEADHPERAIEIANRYNDRIHLLLTDMIMPGMNGEILAERVSAIRPEDASRVHDRVYRVFQFGTHRLRRKCPSETIQQRDADSQAAGGPRGRSGSK